MSGQCHQPRLRGTAVVPGDFSACCRAGCWQASGAGVVSNRISSLFEVAALSPTRVWTVNSAADSPVFRPLLTRSRKIRPPGPSATEEGEGYGAPSIDRPPLDNAADRRRRRGRHGRGSDLRQPGLHRRQTPVDVAGRGAGNGRGGRLGRRHPAAGAVPGGAGGHRLPRPASPYARGDAGGAGRAPQSLRHRRRACPVPAQGRRREDHRSCGVIERGGHRPRRSPGRRQPELGPPRPPAAARPSAADLPSRPRRHDRPTGRPRRRAAPWCGRSMARCCG